jgi:hypothetical protein
VKCCNALVNGIIGRTNTSDDDLSTGVISRGRLIRTFGLSVDCVSGVGPLGVCFWPTGDCIVVRFSCLRDFEECYTLLTKSGITAVASFHPDVDVGLLGGSAACTRLRWNLSANGFRFLPRPGRSRRMVESRCRITAGLLRHRYRFDSIDSPVFAATFDIVVDIIHTIRIRGFPSFKGIRARDRS